MLDVYRVESGALQKGVGGMKLSNVVENISARRFGFENINKWVRPKGEAVFGHSESNHAEEFW